MAKGAVRGLAMMALALGGCVPVESDNARPRDAAASGDGAGHAAASTAPVAIPADPLAPPEWPAIEPAGSIPKPAHYSPDATRPTLLIFFGTWCAGCTAGVLHDAHASRKFAKSVRIGLALAEDRDEKFEEFAKSVHGRIDMPVWTEDDALMSLRNKCAVPGLPAACLLDPSGNVVWTGHSADADKIADAVAKGHSGREVTDARRRADVLVKEAIADPSDTTKRARAVEAAAGFPSAENEHAWDLAQAGNALELAALLSRDAAVASGGLDYAVLDTYAFALFKLGRPKDAFAVATRAMAVCDALDGTCPDERRRYEQFKEAAAKPDGH